MLAKGHSGCLARMKVGSGHLAQEDQPRLQGPSKGPVCPWGHLLRPSLEGSPCPALRPSAHGPQWCLMNTQDALHTWVEVTTPLMPSEQKEPLEEQAARGVRAWEP